MNVLKRFAAAKKKFETVRSGHRTAKVKNLQEKAKVLKSEVADETLKAEKSRQKRKGKATKNFANGVAKAISQGTKNDNAPYWLKEKPKKPYYLK